MTNIARERPAVFYPVAPATGLQDRRIVFQVVLRCMMAIHQLTSAEGNSPVMRRNPDGELFFVAAMLAGKLLMKARFAKE